MTSSPGSERAVHRLFTNRKTVDRWFALAFNGAMQVETALLVTFQRRMGTC